MSRVVAAYQGASPQGDEALAFATIDRVLGDATGKGVGMVVFPELYLLGYNQMAQHGATAQAQGGDWEVRFADLAKRHDCGLTIGWAERDGATVYNTASVFDRTGRKLAQYRKIQLWGPTEQSVFAFGDRYSVFELDGVKTALLICYDIEFAQHVRALADMGVTQILVPTANPADFGMVCNTLVPARATECNVAIVYANYCGADNGLAFCGQSVIAGPYGTILAQASRAEETLLVADLDTLNSIDTSLLSTQAADYRKVSL